MTGHVTPTWLRPLLRRSDAPPALSWRGWAFDVALAAGLAIAAIASDRGEDTGYFSPAPIMPGVPAPPPYDLGHVDSSTSAFGDLQVLVLLLVAAPLALRRRYPLGMLWLVMAMAILGRDDHAVLRLSFYACVIAGYTAAVYSPYPLPAIASLPFAAVMYGALQSETLPTVPDSSVPFLILIPIAVVAYGLRRWKRHADEGRQRLSALEREQAEALRRATEHERARIARDLHDVVTHNVSMMVIQAGAARQVLDAAPEQTREALLAVETSGRSALAELRHVMGLLTVDGDDTAELAPRPGLDRLEALVARVRDTGVHVELTVTGPARPLPDGIELAAYRVVQEALTNTVKHAAGAAARVVVEYGGEHVRVEVTDTGGRPAATSVATGNRQGLIGLRERVAVYRGTLQTGPHPQGGYRVAAVIPVPVEAL